MTSSIRLISTLFITIPAVIFGAFSFFIFRNEYFWLAYVLVSIVFIAASILIGAIFPYKLFSNRIRSTWIQLMIQGILAWLVALLTLTLINSTPLCIGRNNGDGTNTLLLCFLQTFGFIITVTPIEIFLLGISSIGGSFFINRMRAKIHPGDC